MLKFIIPVFIIFFISFNASAQLKDNFDSYVSGQPLACQNPVNWNTWSGVPCTAGEDPLISSLHSLSGLNSVVIVQNNDLVSIFNKTSGIWYVRFNLLVEPGKAGYFAILSDFEFVIGGYWAMECYFDVGGGGRLLANHTTTNFSYNTDTWNYIQIRINLSSDQAQFSINDSIILSWAWTLGSSTGSGPLAIDAINFFGATPNDQMYIDNFWFDNPCLSCYPPFTPTNLITFLNYSPNPQIELNWQDNSFNESNFIILRKNGLPGSGGVFSIIDTVNSNITYFTDANVMIDSTYTYGVLAYNIYGYSDTSNFSTITVEPIPVELISFTVGLNSFRHGVLNWSTASEINNRGFEIERRTVDGQFATIGFVAGYGTTTEEQNYAYVDRSVNPGTYLYRLKQLDFDGRYEYFDEIELLVTPPLAFGLEQNYPNPFNPNTSIKYSIAEAGYVKLAVYNTLGEEISVLIDGQHEAGFFETSFDASNLPSGTYVYRLEAPGFATTKKMLLMK